MWRSCASTSVVVALLASLLTRVTSQSTTAVCGTSFNWMFNEKDQSPCLVAAYLLAPCTSTPSTAEILALSDAFGTESSFYEPPGTGLAPTFICNCNTVQYSLLAACGVCQSGSYVAWSRWHADCVSAAVGYPENIPAAVSVPEWAYADVVTPDNFSVSTAQQVAAENLPDFTGSVASNSPTSSSPFTFSVPSDTFSIPVPTYTIPSGSSPTFPTIPKTHKKTNVGAIVGGVVGGIATLSGVFGGIWASIKRRKRHAAAGSASSPGIAPPPASTPDLEKPPVMISTPPIPPAAGTAQQFVQDSQLAQMPSLPVTTLRPYDPDDPSTFPDEMLNFGGTPPLAAVHTPATQSTPSPGSPLTNTYVPTAY